MMQEKYDPDNSLAHIHTLRDHLSTIDTITCCRETIHLEGTRFFTVFDPYFE